MKQEMDKARLHGMLAARYGCFKAEAEESKGLPAMRTLMETTANAAIPGC